MRSGPIVIIDDDADDRELLDSIFKDLEVPNELKYFESCDEAYAYLQTTADKPFIVFSDINMPKMTGFEMKLRINEDEKLRRKSIPFIFLSTTSTHEAILAAYESLSQGFFTKPQKMEDLKAMVKMILNYWKIAGHPNPNLL